MDRSGPYIVAAPTPQLCACAAQPSGRRAHLELHPLLDPLPQPEQPLVGPDEHRLALLHRGGWRRVEAVEEGVEGVEEGGGGCCRGVGRQRMPASQHQQAWCASPRGGTRQLAGEHKEQGPRQPILLCTSAPLPSHLCPPSLRPHHLARNITLARTITLAPPPPTTLMSVKSAEAMHWHPPTRPPQLLPTSTYPTPPVPTFRLMSV